ncbi:Uncharacterised protein [Mycobacteroides abscessus subsp. abscessus]|nr:Uncharacterised protein [Mycobacteroides abscessus subsp. abscessus]
MGPTASTECGSAQSTGTRPVCPPFMSAPRQVPGGHTRDWSCSATSPRNGSCAPFGPGSCNPHSEMRDPAPSPTERSRPYANRPFGS